MNLNHTHVLAAGLTAAALVGTLLHSGAQAQETANDSTSGYAVELAIDLANPNAVTEGRGPDQARVAGPIGLSGRATFGSVVCAMDLTTGPNLGKQWCVVTSSMTWGGQFNLIGAQHPSSTGTGWLPLTDTFAVYAVGGSSAMMVNRTVLSQTFGGYWLCLWPSGC